MSLPPELEAARDELIEILREEAASAMQEITPARRRRIELTLKAVMRLAAEQVAGKVDLNREKKYAVARSVFLDDAAIASIVLARGAERFAARGLEEVGKIIAALARGVLAGALG